MEQFYPVGVTLLTILSNSFSNIKEISDKYKLEANVLITPAPYTFSIWGLIYSLLLYVTFVHHKEILNTQTPFGSIFMLFVFSSILNALWIQTWGKSLELSSMILIMLAIVLIYITIQLNNSGVDSIIVIAFGIYAAWAFTASLLNLGTLIKKNNIFDNNIIKYITVGLLTIVPLFVKNIFTRTYLPIFLTFIWASIGIMVNGENNIEFILPILSSIVSLLI